MRRSLAAEENLSGSMACRYFRRAFALFPITLDATGCDAPRRFAGPAVER